MAKQLVKLTFPQKLIKKPVTFRMAQKYDVVPNIRRAKVTATVGEIVLELNGKKEDLEKAVKYLSRQGVQVSPVVGAVIE